MNRLHLYLTAAGLFLAIGLGIVEAQLPQPGKTQPKFNNPFNNNPVNNKPFNNNPNNQPNNNPPNNNNQPNNNQPNNNQPNNNPPNNNTANMPGGVTQLPRFVGGWLGGSFVGNQATLPPQMQPFNRFNSPSFNNPGFNNPGLNNPVWASPMVNPYPGVSPVWNPATSPLAWQMPGYSQNAYPFGGFPQQYPMGYPGGFVGGYAGSYPYTGYNTLGAPPLVGVSPPGYNFQVPR